MANLLLGLWLVVSPWLLEFAANVNAMWTHVVLGVLVAAASALGCLGRSADPARVRLIVSTHYGEPVALYGGLYFVEA